MTSPSTWTHGSHFPDDAGWYAVYVGQSTRPRMLYFHRSRGWMGEHGAPPNVTWWMTLPSRPCAD